MRDDYDRYDKDELLESDNESESSSSSEDVTEDEDGLELTPALDAAILRTLNKIRRGEGVYGQERVLEKELEEAQHEAERRGVKAREAKKPQDKPYLLADHQREALLSGLANEYDDDEGGYRRDAPVLTYNQAQAELLREARSAFRSFADDEDDEEGEDGFQPVKVESTGDQVTVNQEDAEADREYRKFLLEMGGGEDQVRSLLKPEEASGARQGDEAQDDKVGEVDGKSAADNADKKNKKRTKRGKKAEAVPMTEEQKSAYQARKAVADEDFLMDYILNRGWIDRGDSEDTKPRKGKKAAADAAGGPVANGLEGDGQSEAGPSHPWGKIDEEDEFDNMAERFEAEYNFRYEEPGSSNIITHPRQIPSLVRRVDDTRATKRAARAERKAAEKAAKEEELRRLKGEKRREMEKQLESLKREVGNGVDWAEIERVLDGDFDEGQWERTLEKMLGAMAGGDDEGDEDNEKPVWDDDLGNEAYDDDDDDEDTDGSDGDHAVDDGPINMDADHLDEPKSKSKKSKGKRVAQPEHDESDSDAGLTIAEKAEKVRQAMQAYHALDHEDVIGDMPTRFKYTRSEPVDYGLTPAEMLLATDAELNTILNMKQLAPYRYGGGYGRQGKGLSKRVRELKEKLSRRKWGEEDEPEDEAAGHTGRPQQRPRDSGWAQRPSTASATKAPATSATTDADEGSAAPGASGKRPGKRLGKKQRQKLKLANGDPGETDVPVVAGQKRQQAEIGGADTGALALAANDAEGGEGGKRKRRKKKHAKGVIDV